MKNDRYHLGRPAVVGLALLAALPAASACEIVSTPWGVQATGCRLNDLYAGRYDVSIDTRPDPYRIPLPNLHVTDIDNLVIGSTVQLSADIVNNGLLSAQRAFDVALVATINDPLNKGQPIGAPIALPPVTLPSLAVGATARVFPGAVSLPNRKQDWDVCSVAVVDPRAGGGSAWGAVVELNESDNRLASCYRVFADGK